MMSQKIRSLHCGLSAGLRFEDIAGRSCLSLHNVPFELEGFIFQWVAAIPSEVRPQILFENTYLTEIGWSAFINWMIDVLDSAHRASDFEDSVIKNLKISTNLNPL